MREKIVAGNWKMNTERNSARELARNILAGLQGNPALQKTSVVLAPPFPFLVDVNDILQGSELKLSAQHMHFKESGAYTGEVSAQMLTSVGCSYVILGHSERRMMFGDSDYDVKMASNAAVDNGLRPIICVGETEVERETDAAYDVLNRQLREAMDGIFDDKAQNCVIAYEPVWAIGTGKTATPEIAQDAHRFLRDLLGSLYGAEVADRISIIYGGSVRPDNAADLFSQPDIDGGLIGGASLKAEDFISIVEKA